MTDTIDPLLAWTAVDATDPRAVMEAGDRLATALREAWERAKTLDEAIEDWVEIDNLTSPPCTAEMLKSSDRALFKAIREYSVALTPETPDGR